MWKKIIKHLRLPLLFVVVIVFSCSCQIICIIKILREFIVVVFLLLSSFWTRKFLCKARLLPLLFVFFIFFFWPPQKVGNKFCLLTTPHSASAACLTLSLSLFSQPPLYHSAPALLLVRFSPLGFYLFISGNVLWRFSKHAWEIQQQWPPPCA